MKTKRSLSGVYYRYQVEGIWDNLVFEDLPETKQDEILGTYNKEQVCNLVKILANKLNEIGEQFDISAY